MDTIRSTTHIVQGYQYREYCGAGHPLMMMLEPALGDLYLDITGPYTVWIYMGRLGAWVAWQSIENTHCTSTLFDCGHRSEWQCSIFHCQSSPNFLAVSCFYFSTMPSNRLANSDRCRSLLTSFTALISHHRWLVYALNDNNTC